MIRIVELHGLIFIVHNFYLKNPTCPLVLAVRFRKTEVSFLPCHSLDGNCGTASNEHHHLSRKRTNKRYNLRRPTCSTAFGHSILSHC